LIREYYDAKLGQYRTENDSYADFEVEVAFLGDSLTDGYDLGLYYPQYTVSNRGIGGETSHGLEERIQVSLYDLKPKVAVILIGGNNLKTMLQNYEHMIADIRQNLPQTRVILCSLTAMGRDWAHKNQIAAYNNVTIEKLAVRYGCAFVDLYTPLLDVDSGELYAAYTVDGVHLTPAGYEVLTAAITPTLEEQLDLYEGIN
jgi:lysophospholipase L1-like esterase